MRGSRERHIHVGQIRHLNTINSKKGHRDILAHAWADLEKK